MFQVQKRSKYISKTVHVISEAQLQVLRRYEILFCAKKLKITVYSTIVSPELRLQPLWRVPNNVFDVISIVYSKTHAHEYNLRIKRCLCLGESVRMRCDTPKMAEDVTRGRRMVELIFIFVFFTHKKYSHSIAKLKLSH